MLKHLQSREDWAEKNLAAKGFTLIELLVVIIILGVLAAVAIFAVGSINDRAKANACKTEKGTVETAAEAWKAQTGAYPGTAAEMTGDVTAASAQLKKVPTYWGTITTTGTAVASGQLPDGCP